MFTALRTPTRVAGVDRKLLRFLENISKILLELLGYIYERTLQMNMVR